MNPWVASGDERPSRRRTSSKGVLRFVPDLQPLSTLALVIATVIAVAAAFSGIADRGSPSVTPPASAEGLAGQTGQAGSATPASPDAATSMAAIPTADVSSEFQRPVPTGEGSCPVEPRPLDEIAAFLRDPGPVTPRAYLPATTPDRATAEEVARAGRTYVACQYAGDLANAEQALQTPRYIYEQPANGYFRQAGGRTDLATREEREQLARLVFGDDLQPDWILVSDEAISQEEYAAAGLGMPGTAPGITATPGVEIPAQGDQTYRPEQAIQLADGRVAVPLTYIVDPADVAEWSSPEDNIYVASIIFSIFAPDPTRDGRWALDEDLWVCLGNGLCDELYAIEEQRITTPLPGAATPAATPEPATPAASTMTRTRSRRRA